MYLEICNSQNNCLASLSL